jgi:hypothetical protein
MIRKIRLTERPRAEINKGLDIGGPWAMSNSVGGSF